MPALHQTQLMRIVLCTVLSLHTVYAQNTAPKRWVSVSAGGEHTCGLASDSTAYCWGSGGSGRLGTGDDDDRLTPAPVLGGIPFRSISAGGDHTCAIAYADSTVYCWGRNFYGQLGNGVRDVIGKQTAPTPIAYEGGAIQVSASKEYSCVVTRTGIIGCWGRAQLLGSTVVQEFERAEVREEGCESSINGNFCTRPIRVPGGPWTFVHAGTESACATSARGNLYCWGHGDKGRLGNGRISGYVLSPSPVLTPLRFRHVSAGDYTCGIAVDSTAYCWGNNFYGRLGNGGKGRYKDRPDSVAGGMKWIGIVVGAAHACALAADSTAHCWGEHRHGQLGDARRTSPTERADRPVAVSGGQKFAQLSASNEHTCAVTASGQLYCWGRGKNGRLGTGSESNALVPTEIPIPR